MENKILVRTEDDRIGYISENDPRLRKDGLYEGIKRLSYLNDVSLRSCFYWHDYPVDIHTIMRDTADKVMNIYFGFDQDSMQYPSNDISWKTLNGKNVPTGELGINHYISYKHKDLLLVLQDIANQTGFHILNITHFIEVEISHPNASFSYRDDDNNDQTYGGEFLDPEKHDKLFSWTIINGAHISGFAYRYDPIGSYTRVKLKYSGIERIIDIDVGISNPLPSKYISNITSISIAQLVRNSDMWIGDAKICGGGRFQNIPKEKFILMPYKMDNNFYTNKLLTIPKNKLPIRRSNNLGVNGNISFFVSETRLSYNMYYFKIYSITKYFLYSMKYLFTFDNLISEDMTIYIVNHNWKIYDDDHGSVDDLFANQGYDSLILELYKKYR